MSLSSIYIIAGEASGDFIGGAVMQALRERLPGVAFHGIGGEKMSEAGLKSMFPMQELSLMGFAEVIPHIRRLKRRIRDAVADIKRIKPDLVITIDSPGFTFRVVKTLRHSKRSEESSTPPEKISRYARNDGTQFIHIVAPTVWAYKPERAQKTTALFDQLLVLLPFEPPYFKKVGLKTTFIGHPFAWYWREKGDGAAFRTRHHIHANATLIGMMPGSRKNEIRHHLPVFRKTALRLLAHYPSLEIVMPLRAAMEQSVRKSVKNWPMPVHLVVGDNEKKDVFAACDAALAKCGTVSLETILAGLPTVTAYRAHPISIWLVRRMTKIPYANLVNIIKGKEVVPEFLQERCTAENLAAAMKGILENDTIRAHQQAVGLEVAAQLGGSDATSPGEKAAEAIVSSLIKCIEFVPPVE